MKEAIVTKLLAAARAVRKNAHAPYSQFYVGSAIWTEKGNIYVGANVENASYPAGVCAECVAVATAVSAGESVIEAVCVVTETSPPAAPCGVCRQVLAEFGPSMEVILATPRENEEIIITSMAALLPGHFSGGSLPS